MKHRRWLAFLLALCMFLPLSGCGKVRELQIITMDSELYTDREVRGAIRVAVGYFRRHFDGCTLTEISYRGDEPEKFAAHVEQYGGREAIVLYSTFETGDWAGGGSLNPNDTYQNWKWILVRGWNGRWRHVDHGYG